MWCCDMSDQDSTTRFSWDIVASFKVTWNVPRVCNSMWYLPHVYFLRMTVKNIDSYEYREASSATVLTHIELQLMGKKITWQNRWSHYQSPLFTHIVNWSLQNITKSHGNKKQIYVTASLAVNWSNKTITQTADKGQCKSYFIWGVAAPYKCQTYRGVCNVNDVHMDSWWYFNWNVAAY